MSDPWQPVGGEPPSTPPPSTPAPGVGGPPPGPPGAGGYSAPPGPGGFPTPPPGSGPGWGPPGAAAPGTDGFCIAALVFGILPCVPLGIIFGIIGLNRTSRSQQKGRGLAIAGIVLACLWGVAGVASVFLADDAERDSEGNITEAGDEDVFSLRVGDCWNNPPSDSEVQEVDAVPCAEPHDAEVYAEFDIPESDTYPGTDEVIAQADQGCFDEFEGFVGISADASTIEVLYLYPTEDSWDRMDDRQVSCIVSDSAGPTTGTLEGAAR